MLSSRGKWSPRGPLVLGGSVEARESAAGQVGTLASRTRSGWKCSEWCSRAGLVRKHWPARFV